MQEVLQILGVSKAHHAPAPAVRRLGGAVYKNSLGARAKSRRVTQEG
jgi:hypothetical protein